MRYSKLLWQHDSPSEPIEILSEHDDDGWELRKIEYFADGSIGFASEIEAVGGAILSQITCPPDGEVESPHMKVVEIRSEEFENAWKNAIQTETIHG